jgi:Asparagine synthase (glutamine-hydrolyzing)
VSAAREAAAALGRSLTVVELDHDDLRRSVRQVVAATGRTGRDGRRGGRDARRRRRGRGRRRPRLARARPGRGRTRSAATRKSPGSTAGWPPTPSAGAVRETIRSLPDGLARDVPVLRSLGVEPVFPFLDDRVVQAALRLPAPLLVDGDERKVALRRAASDSLPAEVASAPKKAAQYGSYVSRELDRLARQAGFKRRTDDHVRRYVESL